MLFDLLLNPGTPYYLVALACLAIAAGALRQLTPAAIGLAPLPTIPDRRRRFVLGQLAGGLLAVLLVMPALISGATGATLQLVAALALAAWLYLGLVLPRKPQVAAEQRRRAVRRLLPGFVAYVRVALQGFDSPVTILERYSRRTDARSAALRAVTTAALTVIERERLRPFAALAEQARVTGCQELIDIADLLAQAEREGSAVEAGLAQQELTLAAILEDEFKTLLKRRTMYLLLLVAISVVVGILGNLLWTMIGSALLSGGGL
jgi:hypothetical protein